MQKVTRTPLVNEPLKKRLLVSYADKKLVCTRQDYLDIKKYFLDRTVGIPRYVKRRLANHYTQIHNTRKKQSQKWANIWLRNTTKFTKEILSNCPFDSLKALRRDELLKDYAKEAADYCLKVVRDYEELTDTESYSARLDDIYRTLGAYCHRWKVKLPYSSVDPDNITDEHLECALLRLCNETWWLRKLTRIQRFTNEHLLIALGEVGKGNSPYVSRQAFNEWQNQQKANREYLQAMEIVNVDTDETMSLEDIANATTANPEKRRIELMVRCRGMEELADDDGYKALFLTLTAPSKYHSAPEKGWKLNKKYQGFSPKQTQAYLVKVWAKIRSSLNRSKVSYYGVRVVEPHHDGTPHWHLLVFVKPSQAKDLISTFSYYALKEDGDEKGAQENRYDVKEVDPEEGSATGYIAKYISKNINGSKMVDDENIDYEAETTAPEGAQRATAWASRWCIRQFQFFGAAPVSLYREFRRVDGDNKLCGALENVRAAADSGRWAEFTKELRKNCCKIKYEIEEQGNKYGEAVRRISGIESDSLFINTRLEKYAIRKRGSALPWSPVNNCTLSDSEAAALSTIGIPEELQNEFLHGARVRVDEKTVYRVVNGTIDEIRT